MVCWFFESVFGLRGFWSEGCCVVFKVLFFFLSDFGYFYIIQTTVY